MCVHKREANRKMSQAHDKINKERAAERLKRQGFARHLAVLDNLLSGGLVKRQSASRPSAN